MAEEQKAQAQAQDATTPAAEEAPKKMNKQEKGLVQSMMKVISRMPESVQDRFKMLHMFSEERSKINDLFENEVAELAEKFEQRKKPILAERDRILKGEQTDLAARVEEFDTSQAKLEEIVAGIMKTEEEKAEDAKEAAEHKTKDMSHLVDKAGIPDFWKTALLHHPMLSNAITDADKAVLEHLTFLTADQVKVPQPRLTVTLTFEENEFFSNSELSFTAVADEDTNETIEIIGTVIDWKEGKDTTKKKVKKTQKNKKTGEKRVIVKTVPCDSFFCIFESLKQPEGIEDKDEDDIDSDDEKTMQMLEEGHDVANDLYDLYTTDALEFYLGFGPELDGLMDGMNGDSDDDDDEPAAGKPKKSGGAGGAGGAPGAGGEGEKPSDCKEQ